MRPYEEFLRSKARTVDATGIGGVDLSPALFPFQRDCVRWALRKGKAAIFSGTGLGKTFQQLEWARHVAAHTGGDVLILAPLAVTRQTVSEGAKFGIEVHAARCQDEVRAGLNVANYETLHRFRPEHFAGVVLDECFAAGTPIDTPNGHVQIEHLREGDEILNASGVDVISDVHRREVPYVVKVTIRGSSYLASPNHPFFTQRGWVGAQDLRAGDCTLGTAAAMRLVREGVLPSVSVAVRTEVLRSVLLSELADEPTGTSGEGTHAGGSGETRGAAVGVVSIGEAGGAGGTRTHRRTQPGQRSGGGAEDLPPIERDPARTFRAWGKWSRSDLAAADADGCVGRGLDHGVSLVIGSTDSRLSHALQAGFGASRQETLRRGGWSLPPEPEGTGSQEVGEACFSRVDGIEILELGHPGLDELRAPDGKLYFYDLGGTRHPSFSVGGNLVHNSSILKAYDGKVRNQIIGAFAQTPFKLACTATPAPNDHMELGNHAEFLGVMTRAEMLATFFVHDGGETQKWRVKGHAERAFWRWLCEWAVMVTRPSDLGYTDDGFDLPPLHIEEHVIPAGPSQRPSAGLLLDARAPRASTLTEQRQARRESLQARVARAAELASASADPWILWCDLNDESTALAKAVPGAVEIRGADAAEDKEQRLRDFAEGRARVLVTKPSIAGFGLNWQHCAHMAFVGLSHSYEALFQAVRRCWRFGQVRPVHVHIITSEVEGAVLENVRRKEADHARMVAEMAEAMREMQRENVQSTIRQAAPYITRAAMEVPAWLA